MKQLLNFLEIELEVPFQLVLLEQEVKIADNRIVKTCYSNL